MNALSNDDARPFGKRSPLWRAASRAARIASLAAATMLGGCSMDLLQPHGAVGMQEKTLILVSLGLMLLVVVPVIVLTLWFAWRYRA